MNSKTIASELVIVATAGYPSSGANAVEKSLVTTTRILIVNPQLPLDQAERELAATEITASTLDQLQASPTGGTMASPLSIAIRSKTEVSILSPA